MDLCWQYDVSAFNMLSSFVIDFLPMNKCLLIVWLQSLSIVILEPKKIKSVTVSNFFPSICLEIIGSVAMILIFECWILSKIFHSPLSPSSRGSLIPLQFLPLTTGALGRSRGMGWRERQEGGSRWGTHVNPWLIHVNVWQKPLQYCKVISLQSIKVNEK